MTPDTAKEIRERHSEGASRADLRAEYGLPKSTLGDVLAGRTWNGAARRIQCLGVGQPCPAWWYHEGPGRPRKRCPRCEEKRRWVALERVQHCVCGKLLLHPKAGRPRVACSAKCARKRRRANLLEMFA